MKISKIFIKNFRLLKDFEVYLEDELSLVIGKNNTGKTSFLTVLERFLISTQNYFSFEDVNLATQKSFKEKFQQDDFGEDYKFGINLKLYITYSKEDDLSNISEIMLNLNPDDNKVVMEFSYSITFEEIQRLKKDFESFKSDYPQDEKDVLYFLKEKHKSFFKIRKRALEYNNENNFVEIDDNNLIDRIINFKRIRAKRDVINPDGAQSRTDKTLSKKSSRYYEKISSPDKEIESIKKLKKQLSQTDESLNKVYTGLFKNLIDKVERFGGTKVGESAIKIRSILEGKNILRDNTSVTYNQDGHSLPEDYYGLGYLNLISIIFEIEVVINDFKRKTSELKKPSDINLFFIEEPEAHTHPQMQYIFINNIKNLLREESKEPDDGIQIDLQTIITTHSSHITAESDFNDIKYFKREDTNKVISKDLKKLKQEYEDSEQYEFLRKYLTLNRAELFFADKAILIEGDTERILLPTFMKKLDIENEHDDMLPLYSQNISVIEVGAYSQIFEKLIDFLGIMTLIITDIDSIDEDEACRVDIGNDTSNQSIKFFLGETDFEDLKTLEQNQRSLIKKEGNWTADEEGQLLIIYQYEENGYSARSFEDAFIHLNRDFINDKKDNFRGLKKRNNFEDDGKDAYDLANNCIKKKTDFALDIIYHSSDEYDNWEIPSYLNEGLLWLKK